MDNLLHILGGAALTVPLVLTSNINPFVVFFVFSAWGLLREQAQKNQRGRTFRENWIEIWNTHKLIEGTTWGIGAFIVSMAFRWLVN